jgi:hypothetical protein
MQRKRGRGFKPAAIHKRKFIMRNLEKITKLVFPIWFCCICNAFSYGGTEHQLLSHGISESLYYSGYRSFASVLLTSRPELSNQSYMDIIIYYSSEPDKIRLTADEINNNNSGLTGYKDDQATLDAAAKYWFDNCFHPYWTSFSSISDLLRNSAIEILKIVWSWDAYLNGGNAYDKLVTAFQHTYVETPAQPEGSIFTKNYPISVSPYAAQTEYNIAVREWKSGNYHEAMRRLGRTMHYIQDITVPHHCEVGGNYPDIIVAGSMGKSSQYNYETLHIESCFAWQNDAQGDNHFFKVQSGGVKFANPSLLKDELIFEFPYAFYQNPPIQQSSFRTNERNLAFITSVADLIKNMQNYVITPGKYKPYRYLEYADGLDEFNRNDRNYSTCGGMYTDLSKYAHHFIFPIYLYIFKGDQCTIGNWTNPKCLCTEDFLCRCYNMCGVSDNYDLVSNELVPFAIRECAKVVQMFFAQIGEKTALQNSPTRIKNQYHSFK